MEIKNQIKMYFKPECYMDNDTEIRGAICKNTFIRHRQNELILKMEIQNSTTSSKKTGDLKVCFIIDKKMMPIKPIQYCYPAREFVLSRDNCDYECKYGYRYPLSFVSATYNNTGVTLIFDDQKQSSVRVLKQDDKFKFTIQYKNISMQKGIYNIRIIFHGGDWHSGLKEYKAWYKTKYMEKEEIDKRLLGSYHIRRYFFNTRFCKNAIYNGKDYTLRQQYKDDRMQVGGVDIALLFDYAYTPENNIRCGNAQPFLNLNNLEEFNKQIQACKKEGGLTTYAYFDPYLVQDDSDYDKLYRDYAPVLNQKGEIHHIWTKEQWHPCPSVEQWQYESMNYLENVDKGLEVDGFYLDEMGNGEQFICYNKLHNHSIPSDQNKNEYNYVSSLKRKFPKKLYMCEFFPTDSNISLFPSVLSDSKTIVDICRFAFPYKKIFKIIDCDRPIGNNTWDINKVFFNGMGLWLDNDLHDPEWYSQKVRTLIKKHYKILRKYSRIFESLDVEPLMAISSDRILVNRFTNGNETIFTFINIGTEFTEYNFFPGDKASKVYDVYNDRICNIFMEGDMAGIKIGLKAREVTCIYVAKVAME